MRRLDVSKGRIVDEPAMATIHQLHKGLAVVTFIYMLILGARALLCRPLRLIGLLLLVFTVLQVLLGIMSVLNGLPLLLVTGHNTVAALLLLTITDLNQKLFRTKTT
jgi:cytochrome c oxidase assembly protein subunit 15